MTKEVEIGSQIGHARFNDHIYLLGNYERRITLHTQQIRATNLVYALFKRNVLNPDKRLAIVGAGASGLSAAAAAALLGVKAIHVYEQGDAILPVWRDSTTRWFHPCLYNWPEPGWNQDSTKLPRLNWKAGEAKIVASQIERDWNTLYDFYSKKENGLVLRTGTRVRIPEGTNQIAWGDYGDSKKYDIIILAVGFGRDGNLNDEETCYWANDNVATHKDAQKKYFLSGTGDGAISDLLRIRLSGFNMDTLTKWLSTRELQLVSKKVRQLEKEILNRSLNQSATQLDEYLKDEYARIETPEIEKSMRAHLRSDTHLHLHTKGTELYGLGSFPLNRFLLSRFMKLKDQRFSLVSGNLTGLESLKRYGSSAAPFTVQVKGHGPLLVDSFISRHGPERSLAKPGLEWIDSSDMATALRARNALDQTGRSPIYDPAEIRDEADITTAYTGDRIVIAIIENKRTREFLFTKRRTAEAHLLWGFPAKKLKTKNADAKRALILECEQETGVTPNPKYCIGQRVHQATGNLLEYWYCTYKKGKAQVKDEDELSEVMWMKGPAILKKAKDWFGPLKTFLNERGN